MDIKTEVDGVEFHNQQYSEIDREKGLLISHDKYTITNDDGEAEYKANTFSLQLYTAQELQTLLEKNGFDLIQQYDMEGQILKPSQSLNILTVAKVKS